MWCPFLKAAEVRFCELSPFRKWIERVPLPTEREICTGSGWIACPLASGRPETRLGLPACPFLRQRQMLYCSASAAPRYIPYSDALASRCQSEGHCYCDAYLALADPHGAAPLPAAGDGDNSPPAPEHLWFAPNHMWLDARADGTAVLGLDAFLARIAGRVDAVTFVTPRGVCRPAVAITVAGVDLSLVFPNPIELTGVNVAVRENPLRLIADPYVRGWLFCGRSIAAAPEGGATAGLKRGEEAARWMRAEWDRAAGFLHAHLGRADAAGVRVLNDGGSPAAPFARELDREDRLRLFNEFFAGLDGRPS